MYQGISLAMRYPQTILGVTKPLVPYHVVLEVNNSFYTFHDGVSVETVLDRPASKYSKQILGTTGKSPIDVASILDDLRPEFTSDSYHLMDHSCAHFCLRLATALEVDVGPHQAVVDMHDKIASTHFGGKLRAAIKTLPAAGSASRADAQQKLTAAMVERELRGNLDPVTFALYLCFGRFLTAPMQTVSIA
jgi:hypothetical protein